MSRTETSAIGKVLTCGHNDLDFIENVCRKREVVAYVADGAYSMGGTAPVPELRDLQQRCGLFLYLDDPHSLSAYGPRGKVWSGRSSMVWRTGPLWSLRWPRHSPRPAASSCWVA